MRYFDLLPRVVTESGYKTLLVKTEEIRIEKRVRKIENWKFENKKIINESERKRKLSLKNTSNYNRDLITSVNDKDIKDFMSKRKEKHSKNSDQEIKWNKKKIKEESLNYLTWLTRDFNRQEKGENSR